MLVLLCRSDDKIYLVSWSGLENVASGLKEDLFNVYKYIIGV